jgi:protoporphyrinogen/coproporphyrinogen III oxidase
MQSRTLILGGGITGLSAAAYLKKLAPDSTVTIWESRERLGGVLQTEFTEDGFLIEQSADNFLCNEPWATDLAELVGIRDELIPTRAYDRRASILSRGQIHNVPNGFVLMSPSAIWPMLTTPLLSWSAKLRMAREWFVAPRPADQKD